jgi:hypothetical protein
MKIKKCICGKKPKAQLSYNYPSILDKEKMFIFDITCCFNFNIVYGLPVSLMYFNVGKLKVIKGWNNKVLEIGSNNGR